MKAFRGLIGSLSGDLSEGFQGIYRKAFRAFSGKPTGIDWKAYREFIGRPTGVFRKAFRGFIGRLSGDL